MPRLEDIPALPTDAKELLEAVGYLDTRDLHEADTAELVEELVKANKVLSLMAGTPNEETVEEWKSIATEYAPVKTGEDEAESGATDDGGEGDDAGEAGDTAGGTGEEAPDGAGEETAGDAEEGEADAPGFVNFEEDPEVQDMLRVSPEAVPLHSSLIRRHKLAVGDIPEGILLTRCQGEVEINVMTTSRLAKAQRREAELRRTGLMGSRIRSFDDIKSGGHNVKPLEKGGEKEVLATSEGLNAGVDPHSRRFIKGVLHPHPTGVRVSAFFAVLVEVMLLANLIGIPWMVYYDYSTGNSMTWWVVGLASGMLLSALCYLIWGISARCRVCGQRQFAPKKCLKNKKAHHIPVLGYILPTALQALIFKWFYCIYCGTAVRLKK